VIVKSFDMLMCKDSWNLAEVMSSFKYVSTRDDSSSLLTLFPLGGRGVNKMEPFLRTIRRIKETKKLAIKKEHF